jgi:hypothetical protein
MKCTECGKERAALITNSRYGTMCIPCLRDKKVCEQQTKDIEAYKARPGGFLTSKRDK